LIGLYDADNRACASASGQVDKRESIAFVLCCILLSICHLINNNEPLISIFGCLTQNITELNPRTRESLRFDKRYECYLRPAGLMVLVNF